MQKKEFIRQLNELVPRPDPVTTEALYRFDRECAETEYIDMLTALRVVARNFSEETLQGAYEIIQRKGATYYGIAMAVSRIAECVMKDEHAMLPVSVLLEGQYGLDGLCLSVPSIVGENGVETVLEIPLDEKEHQALLSSAQQLKEVIATLDLP